MRSSIRAFSLERDKMPLPRSRFGCLMAWTLLLVAFCPLAQAQIEQEDYIVGGKFRVITAEEEQELAGRLSATLSEQAYIRSGQAGSLEKDGRSQLTLQQIPSSYTGTGLPEWIEYQVPDAYYPAGPALPMLVCWHSYGQSCQSVAYDSQLDEECNSRGWFFLSITGAQQCNFGYLVGQIHCTKAIDYLRDELGYKIDTDRIYMAGLSMGGGGAANYAGRHLSGEEGYRIAGLILVAASVDLVHAYYQNDPGVQYWLPLLVGGPPTSHNFQYRQIGTLTIISGDTYRLDRSVGQNLNNNMPIYQTYAGNDPLSYGPFQNAIFADMLTDIGANIQVEYMVTHPSPHKWALLDIETSFDFVEAYSLQDQNTDDLQLVIDRSTKYYWADVTTVDPYNFAGLIGESSSAQNRVTVSDTSNLDSLKVDCTWAGLDISSELSLHYSSFEGIAQNIMLQPISTEPTYIVDDEGTLFHDYTYSSAEEQLAISWSGLEALDLKSSFEQYNLTLSIPQYVQLAQQVQISMSGGAANNPYLLFFAVHQKETKVGCHHILVDPLPPTLWFFSVLNGVGESSLFLTVPNDGGLLGTTFYMQFLTYGPQIKEISNMTATTIQL
ncbi:MAG: hypothetical protein ABIK28_18880 [Planctomycetota bacterium]